MIRKGATLVATGASGSYFVTWHRQRIGLLTRIKTGPKPWVGRPITEGTLGERLRGASRSEVVDLLIEWAERVGPPTGPQQPKVDPPAVRRPREPVATESVVMDALPRSTRRASAPFTANQLRGYEWLPAKVASRIPGLYATEAIPLADKVAHVKFFAGSMTWYAVELDASSGRAFGFVHNGSDPHGSEFGYFLLDEMRDLVIEIHGIPVWIERDLHWTPSKIPASQRERY